MAEYFDNDVSIAYKAAVPIQDRRNHPSLVPPGQYPRLVGVDGRMLGSFRRFPGFLPVVDIHGIDAEEANDVSGIALADFEIWFFKYISVQVVVGEDTLNTEENAPYPQPFEDATERTLRGFVIAHPYTQGGETRGILRFVYYNEMADAWESKTLLREVNALTNDAMSRLDRFEVAGALTTIEPNTEYDVAAMGPFLYFALTCPQMKGYPPPQPSGEETGYSYSTNQREFWSRSIFIASTGDESGDIKWCVTEFGPLYSLHSQWYWNELTEAWTTYTSGSDPTPNVRENIRLSFRMFSGFKNVAGPLHKPKDFDAEGTPSYFEYDHSGSGAPLKSLQRAHVDDDMLSPIIQTYRTIDSYWFETPDVDVPGPVLGGTLFLEGSFRVVPFAAYGIDPDLDEPGEGFYDSSDENPDMGLKMYFGHRSDIVLANAAVVLDPLRHDTAFAPKRIRLMLPYQGTMLRIGSMPRPMPPATYVDRQEILSWGALTKYAPEESRLMDATPLGDGRDEYILALVGAGDYAFAIGDSSIYRIHRNGQLLAINEIQTMAGGVGRYAAIGVGTSLYHVSPSGLFVTDGATNQFQLVGAFDRIILEDWKDSLGSIRMAYDLRLGALILLNDDEDEMVALWSNTGAITTLKGCPWKFGTQGINPSDAGVHRSFWIMKSGQVHTPNAGRSSVLSMCGTDGADTYCWNGTVSQTWNDGENRCKRFKVSGDDPAFSSAIGFYVYMTSGNNAGISRAVEGIEEDGTELLFGITDVDKRFPYEVVEGDTFSIAPIEYEIVGWPMQRTGAGINLFRRKVITAMGHNVRLLGGETGENNPNRSMSHRIYHRGDLATAIVDENAILGNDPTKNYSGASLGGMVLLPAWRQLASNLDFEWLGGVIQGKITVGKADSGPEAFEE